LTAKSHIFPKELLLPTSRERVMQALNFQPTDRVPRDLGGMRSTSISAFGYPRLVSALGLPTRLPRVEDTGQMLALPDLDVLDALGIDVVTILDGVTNAFEQPQAWHDYDFNGRLPARVRFPKRFKTQPDGSIRQGNARMLPSAYVFDDLHGGQPLDLSAELPKPDLAQLRRYYDKHPLTDTRIRKLRQVCRRVRETSERAVFMNDGFLQIPLGVGGWSGLAIFPILCVTEPDFVAELHELVTQRALANLRALLPEIGPYVDVIMTAADDWGTQNNTIASPKVFQKLFQPYYTRVNDTIHALAPGVKSFLHSCGAIYSIIDLVIESRFDILNPVQWSAGKHTYQEWKDKARGRIALWGGGVNSQVTLPLGSVEAVAKETREVVAYLAQDSGYVFCNIHNILAEIAPEKVIAMYRAV
jgi:uroporphyrinogen decarboxylase